MDSQQIPVIRRNMRLDGVTYDLLAVSVGGGDYQASWRCPKCQVGGTSKLYYSRSSGALDWAQQCAQEHERLVHDE